MNFTIDLMIEILYRLKHAAWRGVWAWFMESGGVRLVPTALLIWATGRLIYALVSA